jgi:pimeloyl-ACP methyl ester carboxylesterase
VIHDRLGAIDYDERGPTSAPTLILVPGSCSTGAAWRPVIAEWRERYRCVTTSLLGYGRTAERRTVSTADMAHAAEMLETVVRRAVGATGEPVHVVGHSAGATTALAVALRNRVPVASLTLIEPPIPELLRHTGEHGYYAAFRQMTDAYFEAFRGGDRSAIGAMIDFYGGPGTFADWPQKVRDYAIATTAVNLLDWMCAYSFHLTPACLAKVEVPTLVIRGERSHPAMKHATELLAGNLPNGRLLTIAGAAHFMIATHATAVADEVDRYIASNAAMTLATPTQLARKPGESAGAM